MSQLAPVGRGSPSMPVVVRLRRQLDSTRPRDRRDGLARHERFQVRPPLPAPRGGGELQSVALRADEDRVRAGRDVDVRRDALEMMEAVDVVQEDCLGREADPAREAKEGRVHEEAEGREEEGAADDDNPRGRKEERVPEAEEECRVREGVLEAEVEAGMDGEVGEPTIKVTEAPVEDSSLTNEVAADEARAVEGRAEPPTETRRGAEPTAAELHAAPEATDVHPTAKACAVESHCWRAGQ